VKYPEEGNIYNYRYNLEDKSYQLWEEAGKNNVIDQKLLYH
jgi:hypothetical protein